MKHWLMKSEPSVFGIDDLAKAPRRTSGWDGVRNYQVRNMLRDEFAVGDLAFFYHSSCPQPGVAGIIRIASEPYPDPTQFNPADEYFDPKASPEKPIWQLVDVAWAADLAQPVPLETIRSTPELAEMLILRKGNRLSITPVTPAEFLRICQLGGLRPREITALG